MNLLNDIDNLVWGLPLILLILVGGIFLTIRTRFIQFRKLVPALKYAFSNEKEGIGEISSFSALMTALSATIGTGNIVGVATAVIAGGAGALFWMIIAAILGMATKYSEGFLAVKYREVRSDGHSLGGPFYYIEKGIGKKAKPLAYLFSIFGVLAGLLGIGTITQINGITSVINNFFSNKVSTTVNLFSIGSYSIVIIISSVILTIIVALVVVGGAKRISRVSEIIVPFMGIIYILATILILILNYKEIPNAYREIFIGAFNPKAVSGGAIGSIIIVMKKGIGRGIFSNEAGLGSAPIAAAAAKTKDPTRQGLVSMTGTFLDTIIICSLTGLSILVTKAHLIGGLEGAEVTSEAFVRGLPFPRELSKFILMICLVFFAFTTILGWNYYSERCLEYLVKGKKLPIKIFKFLYILAVFIGPYLSISAVWTLADIFNGLMAIPNMIGLFILSSIISKDSK